MGAPIRAFVGSNGDGKTLGAMALVVEPALRRGRKVVATCGINHPNASVLESWRDIPDLEDCVLLLDEISSSLPSRGSMGAPAQLVRKINQLRKSDVECCWTAPNWARADVALREVTKEVTTCKGYVTDPWKRQQVIPPVWRPRAAKLLDDDGKPVSENVRWRPNCLFRYRTFDASAFDEFSLHAVKQLKPLESFWYWRPWHTAQFLYETLEGVSLLDHVDETGVCIACGGLRRRGACTCPSVDRSRTGPEHAERARPARSAPLGTGGSQ